MRRKRLADNQPKSPLAWVWMALTLPLFLYACVNSKTTNPEEQRIKEEIKQLSEEGKKARESNQFELAISKHQKELSLARSIGDSLAVVKALNNIGTNYRRLDILDEAANYHYEALKIAKDEKYQNDEEVIKSRLIALNGLGNVYLSLGNWEEAEAIFKEALAGENIIDSKRGQAINLANIGKIKKMKGQIDSAWIYYRHSLAMNRQIQSKLGEAICFSQFAKLHEDANNPQEAISEYQHAIDIMADSPDDWHKLDATLSLANLYISLNELQKALPLLEQGKETAERIQSLNHRSIVHKLYYELYERKGNAKTALEHYKLSIQLQDSIVDTHKKERIEKMRFSLDREHQRNN